MDTFYIILATALVIYIYLLYFTIKNIINFRERSMRIVIYNIIALFAHIAAYSAISVITLGAFALPLIFFTAISYFVYVYYSVAKLNTNLK